MKKILSLLALIFSIPSLSSAKDITPSQASELMADKNVVILDVRTPSEYAQGHIKGSILINFESPNFQEETAKLDKNKTYLIYCRSGRRSASAESVMKKQGFNNLYNLKGGVVAWGDSNMPLVK